MADPQTQPSPSEAPPAAAAAVPSVPALTPWYRQAGPLALLGLGLLLMAPPVFLGMGEEFYITLLTRMVIYGLAAASLDLILGYGGMVSFGHAAFVGVGGYVAGLLAYHGMMSEPVLFGLAASGTNNLLILWSAAMLGGGFAAFVIGSICLRTTGVHFIMITLAFAQMVFFFFVSLEAYGGDDGLPLWYRAEVPGLGLDDDLSVYYLAVGLLALFLLLARRLTQSRFGLVIRAARQNPERLAALGVPVYRHKLILFTLAGAVAGLAGAMEVNQTGYLSPSLMQWTRSGELLVIVILGGMGTLFGPVLGAIAFIALEHVLAGWTEHWALVFGPALVLCVLFFRTGLWGLICKEPRG
ncbi:MAG: branched-chain amino acid ABC transporter permease [Rhodospirillaceae bacterium]